MPENTGDRYGLARTVLSRIPHGVAIIGAADGPERSCATGTAMYVSFDPPMLAIAEHPGSRTCKLIQPDKLATLKIKPLEAPADAGGAPAVAGSIAVLWCKVRDVSETGDHLLFTGEVVAHRIDEAKIDALLRYRRRYAHIGHETSVEAPEGYPT